MSLRSSSPIVIVVALALTLAACGDDDAGSSPVAATSTSAPESGNDETSEPELSRTAGMRSGRYCEVLVVRGDEAAGFEATVWNTFGLNECPGQQWEALDMASITDEQDATLALRNGPRYWLMDEVEKVVSEETVVEELDGMEMRRLATVGLGPSLADATTRYEPRQVERKTVFTWSAGQEVYELTAVDGTTYVMQSWSQQVDTGLAEGDLASLGDRLELPEGWTYGARVLGDDLVVTTIDEPASVLQDELMNSYTEVPAEE